MQETLRSAVQSVNQSRRLWRVMSSVLGFAQILAFAWLFLSLWQVIGIDQLPVELGLIIGLISIALVSRRKWSKINVTEDMLLVQLDMQTKAPEAPVYAYLADQRGSSVDLPVQDKIIVATNELKSETRLNVLRRYSPLLWLVLANVAVSFVAPVRMPDSLAKVAGMVASFAQGATLTVLEGVADAEKPTQITLRAGSTADIEVLSENLLEVSVRGSVTESDGVTVELRREQVMDGEDPVFQRFRLNSSADVRDGVSTSAINFSATDTVLLYIPSLAPGMALAKIRVKNLPVPRVSLKSQVEFGEDPWPDDRPIPLSIQVRAENPLKVINLVIRSGGKSNKELVLNVVADEKKEIDIPYAVTLEPYLESDYSEVEIIAEATDRSLPMNLTGQSNPLRVSTVSAYGRYRQTLNTMRSLKEVLDEAVRENGGKPDKKITELMKKALKQSDESPFFDGIDRMQLDQFDASVEALLREPEATKALALSSELNDFLFEHEAIDDKERDRDFFVAMRGLSRVVEQPTKTRTADVKVITRRIKQFLDDRYKRWERRVARIGSEYEPKHWPKVKVEKPFHGYLNQVEKLAGSDTGRTDSFSKLTKANSEYREWIEDLERMEEMAREKREQQRQQGIANARDMLKELQKRQGEVSQYLDRASDKKPADMEAGWPAAKMQQKENINGTEQLENQMRSLSPTAGERLKVAVDAMKLALESGSAQKFPDAEQGSDLAVRLLRQADSAAQKSQQQPQEGRRRRRVSGDGYYGQSIAGGDIEIRREYQVDQRYREDVLNDVRHTLSNGDEDSSGEDRKLLENYLRSVVR
jgi:hypothetical protein